MPENTEMRDIEDVLATLPWVIEARELIQKAKSDPRLKPQARAAYRRMLVLNKPIIKAYSDSQKCPLL